MSIDHESLIAGLIALGRTREEAELEIRRNEERQDEAAERRLWNNPRGCPRTS